MAELQRCVCKDVHFSIILDNEIIETSQMSFIGAIERPVMTAFKQVSIAQVILWNQFQINFQMDIFIKLNYMKT